MHITSEYSTSSSHSGRFIVALAAWPGEDPLLHIVRDRASISSVPFNPKRGAREPDPASAPLLDTSGNVNNQPVRLTSLDSDLSGHMICSAIVRAQNTGLEQKHRLLTRKWIRFLACPIMIWIGQTRLFAHLQELPGQVPLAIKSLLRASLRNVHFGNSIAPPCYCFSPCLQVHTPSITSYVPVLMALKNYPSFIRQARAFFRCHIRSWKGLLHVPVESEYLDWFRVDQEGQDINASWNRLPKHFLMMFKAIDFLRALLDLGILVVDDWTKKPFTLFWTRMAQLCKSLPEEDDAVFNGKLLNYLVCLAGPAVFTAAATVEMEHFFRYTATRGVLINSSLKSAPTSY